jgi:hypothetical protein|tara:strand:- start:230 stop:364 length:135 start_codon:yes stop_codon:yes gene_type:complete
MKEWFKKYLGLVGFRGLVAFALISEWTGNANFGIIGFALWLEHN